MNWRTLLVLVLVVIGLGWYVRRTAQREEQSLADLDVRLFPGLDENLVTVVRIENVMRDLNLRFERDAAGLWSLTDPVAARAEPGTVELVVQAALRARGRALGPDEGADLASLGLDPPRFVLELGEGDAPRQRAEIGAVELDGARVFARTGDRSLRVSRELEPLISRDLHEFRASSISDVDPRHVVEVRRRGTIPAADGGGASRAVDFDAVLEAGAWRATAPVVGLLDPAGMALFVQSVATYRFESIFDEGERALGTLGLDPPEFRVEMGTIGTETLGVLFGRTGSQRQGGWLGTRDGSRVVWPISAVDVGFFGTPLEDLLDHKLLRARRSGVTRFELDSAAGRVRLVRGLRGWTCASARAGSNVFGPESAAQGRVIEDVLGALESYELTGFLPGASFTEGTSPVRWRVEGEGLATGGTFGAPYVDAAGATGVLFQREGETAVAHGDAGILALLARDPVTILSSMLLESNEVDLTGLRLRRGSAERIYERNAKGLWTRPGGSVEARELRPVLDTILFLRAVERFPESRRLALEDVIEVELVVGGTTRASIGVAFADIEGTRRVVVVVDGQRGLAQDPRLHEKLASLLAGP